MRTPADDLFRAALIDRDIAAAMMRPEYTQYLNDSRFGA